ncbi:MAG TPA: anti-sigma F factor [Clostridia bacterium]|nr:anti-sigma F factor [Clostridia bacterium]
MRVDNKFKMEIYSLPENVAFARVVVASFASQLEFTLSDLEELKVAVSETVANSIMHGYNGLPDKLILIQCTLHRDRIEIIIEDEGKGIDDVSKAMQPSHSTDPERMGLGLVFVKSFTDSLKITSAPGKGTKVMMSKKASTVAGEQVAATEH